MNELSRLTSLCLLALATTMAAALAAERNDGVGDPELAGAASVEPGAWRTKIQQVFDPATRTLSRRMYTIWDAEPSRDLDFIWTPDRLSDERPGRINGSGHLIWRIKGKPAYDPSSVFAEYRGTLREGRIEGRGIYLARSGLYYDGEWKAGRMDGRGTLTLPSGDEYVGQFRSGKANGPGRLIDVTGEIYEGPFVDGRRHGRGTTTLPSGYKYTSLWTAGKEGESSRLIRLAQAPGTRVPGGSDDIRIAITLDKRLPVSSRNEAGSDLQKGDLWYAVSNAANGLLIRPDNRRLMSMWKGRAEIQLTQREEEGKNYDNYGVLSLVRGQLVPLNFMIEVQNRSPRPAQITGVYLQVDSSVTDLQPAIQMSQDSAFEEYNSDDGHYRPYYFVENFGWSAAKDAKLQLKFVNPRSPASATPRRTNTIGPVERSVKVNFENDLEAAGVNLSVLKRNSGEGFPCRSKQRAGCLREVVATVAFGSLGPLLTLDENRIMVGVSGELEYVWEDASGAAKQASSPFSIKLMVGALKTEVEQGEGGQREIISRKTQQLQLDAKDYRIAISYQTTVAAGQTARLVLPVEAEKSSSHDLSIVIQLADGREIKSRPINLLYYRPRWFALSTFDRPAPQGDEDLRANYYLVGDDLGQLRKNYPYDCQEACAAEPRCRGYTYDNWRQTCFLKSSAKETRLDPQYAFGLKKGTPLPSSASVPKIIEGYRNQAFSGFGYLIAQQTTLEECNARCAAEDACVAFTFKRREQNCSLFDQVEPYKANPDTDSGIKRQPLR